MCFLRQNGPFPFLNVLYKKLFPGIGTKFTNLEELIGILLTVLKSHHA